MFNLNDRIGEIAKKYPDSMLIFKEYNIDFCCGGDRPLAEAIKEKNLDGEEIINKINDEYQHKRGQIEDESRDWETASLTELVDYIVNKHHTFLREKLPEISQLVTKILQVHNENHGEVLSKVHRLFHNLKIDLEQHLIKEENKLFPVIKEYEKDPTVDKLEKTFVVINELADEHEGAGDILKELRQITQDYTVPDDGCNTYRLSYQLLEELEDDLFQHIHLENNILFPRLNKEKVEEHSFS